MFTFIGIKVTDLSNHSKKINVLYLFKVVFVVV